MNREQLLEAIEQTGKERAEGEARLGETNDRLAGLLAKAKAREDVDMTEAAERAGIGRTMAYKLINERT